MTAKPSKSARKREAQAVQALADELVGMNPERLAAMPLDDELRRVVEETRAIASRSAGKRQRLYLAKLLRQRDLEALQAARGAAERAADADRRLFRESEQWREKLLTEPSALQELAAHTGASLDELAALLEAHGQARADREITRLRREIFRAVSAALRARMQNGPANG